MRYHPRVLHLLAGVILLSAGGTLGSPVTTAPAARDPHPRRLTPDAPVGALNKAVRDDHYAWHPRHDPKTGVFYGHRRGPETRQWRLRGERDGRVLWERPLDGTPAATVAENWYAGWQVWDWGKKE